MVNKSKSDLSSFINNNDYENIIIDFRSIGS